MSPSSLSSCWDSSAVGVATKLALWACTASSRLLWEKVGKVVSVTHGILQIGSDWNVFFPRSFSRSFLKKKLCFWLLLQSNANDTIFYSDIASIPLLRPCSLFSSFTLDLSWTRADEWMQLCTLTHQDPIIPKQTTAGFPVKGFQPTSDVCEKKMSIYARFHPLLSCPSGFHSFTSSCVDVTSYWCSMEMRGRTAGLLADRWDWAAPGPAQPQGSPRSDTAQRSPWPCEENNTWLDLWDSKHHSCFM